MVLGFGRKKKPVQEPVVIRTSPSLPDLAQAQQRIPWPKDLVDLDAVYAETEEQKSQPPQNANPQTPNRATKTSFQGVRGPVPFHRPFREGTTIAGLFTPSPSKIAGLFGSGVPPPPSSFTPPGTTRTRTGSNSRRRAKAAPTFNVMVVGPKRTGKTSLINLLLDTSNISPANTQDQLNSLMAFRKNPPRPTRAIANATIEILQAPPSRQPTLDDRMALKCIDTPGLDYSEGREFALEVSVSEIVKYIEQQFAETMQEESKVVRTSKGDQHVHLCIYLIDPDSVMTPAARRAKSRYGSATAEDQPYSEYDSGTDDEGEDDDEDMATDAGHTVEDTQSEDNYGEPEPPVKPVAPAAGANGNVNGSTAVADDKTPRNSIDPSSQLQSSPQHPQSPPMTPKSKPSSPQSQPHTSPSRAHEPAVKPESPFTKGKNRLSMRPAEVRVISRLAKRVNVLPIIARADTLTDSRLERIKRAVRRDLSRTSAGGERSVWSVWDSESGALPGRSTAPPLPAGAKDVASAPENGNGTSTPRQPTRDDDDDDDDRPSRPVIKLRGSLRGLTRSRSRKSLKSAVDAESDEPDAEATPGYAYPLSPVSPSTTANDTGSMLSKRDSTASNVTRDASGGSMGGGYGAIFSRTDLRMRMPFAVIAPERERHDKKQGNLNGSVNGNGAAEYGVYGRFVRHFRWGTIDVLDPGHCDFAALRAAVLGSYMRSLKNTTKDVLYERFRTEKLLARRATANISETERKKIMEDLGLSP